MAKVELYDYQKEAIKRLNTGSILCGGVGSGKSRTALAYFFTLQGGCLDPLEIPKDSVDLYIITTARKRDTLEWEEELLPFNMSVDSKLNRLGNKIVVDSWNNISKYTDVEDAFFIFDEQRVVGKGQWVKSFLKITKRINGIPNNNWILLSATPGDSWTDYIPVFIANGFYRNRSEFYNKHIIWAPTKYPKVQRYIETGRLIRLRNKILVTMNFERATISHQESITTDYDIRKYKDAIRTRWNPYKDEPMTNASDLCFVLRRICNEDPSRFEAVKSIVEIHQRVIIFYNFDYELYALREMKYSIPVTTAEWNSHKHEDIPTTPCWVYLVQYNACEGWNCISTDTIIFFSQSYSYKTVVQAAGRIDRLNTPYKDLYYYHLRSKSGIDIAIMRALKNKKQFNEQAFYRSFEK